MLRERFFNIGKVEIQTQPETSENCKEKIHGGVLLTNVAEQQLVNVLTKDSVTNIFH